MSKQAKINLDLSPKKRALLEAMLKKKGVAVTQSQMIPRRAGDEPVVASFIQERVWFLDQLEPGSAAYNMTSVIRLNGSLNLEALRESLSQVVARHESLHTKFVGENGVPFQVVVSPEPLAVPLIDLTDLPVPERTAEVHRLSIDEATLPFDLSQAPLIRASVLRLSDAEHILLLTLHHIIADGWSVGIFMHEVCALYEAALLGRTITLPELPIQYADYSIWQRRQFDNGVMKEQLDYWTARLKDAPSSLLLPADFVRPPVQSFRGQTFTQRLPKSLNNALTVLSQQEGVTLFMTLLAAFNTLLFRYTHQEDILVGTPIANRNQPETERLIGFLLNTLILRTDLSKNPTFRELLQRVRTDAVGAFTHQDVPMDALFPILKPDRDLSHSPFFQVMFNLLNYDKPPQLPGLTMSMEWAESGTAKYDLVVSMEELEDIMTADWEFNTDLFEPVTVRRMSDNFERLLEGIAANPNARLSELPLLTAAEQERIVVEWNKTRKVLQGGRCLHELVEARAAETPGATAVVCGGASITYGELNDRANKLALHLQALGSGAESIVGLCTERSIDMIVGMLAILKSGAAYLPIDPKTPADRISLMLQDAAAGLLVTQPELGINPQGVQIVDVTRECGPGAPLRSVHPQNGAYVIYTSGSTGKPKGVLVQHDSVVNYVEAAAEHFGIEPTDRVLQFASISFDTSAEEIYPCLAQGGTLVLRTEGMIDSAAGFLRACEDQGITVLDLPTAYWHEIVAAMEREDLHLPSTIRLVIIGGEEALPQRVAQWKRRVGRHVRLINTYGPTETTIVALQHELTTPEPSEHRRRALPIGRPVANTRCYVLDREGNLVPAGVEGELHIGGAGLARGYVNQPGQTAERFIPDPFSDEPGARLYRTGDLGRYRADGSIEFLGRIDHQVKIRGFRVELGEIEAALTEHPGVMECAVAAVEENAGTKRLVAYVVSTHGAPLSTADMRTFLKERLPEYMVPATFVAMDKLPQTTSGKVDRRALPKPELSKGEQLVDFVPPQGPVQETIAGIWSEVLHVNPVGAEDNFFELGGHSLIATQVVSRMQSAFGVEIPLRQLFAHPTVAGLAEVVEQHLRSGELATVGTIERMAREGELPLSFAQERLWFLEQLDGGSAAYNIPAAVRFEGRLDVEALRWSVGEVVRRHEVLRTAFENRDGRAVAVVRERVPVELPIVNLQHLSGAEQQVAVRAESAAEAAQPFDLAAGPLVRMKLLRLGDQEHVLLFTLHHIVADGWSMGVLIREVSALYEAHVTGQNNGLEDLPIQYIDYAMWQRRWLTHEVLGRQIDWWKEQLSDSDAALHLPCDRSRNAGRSARAEIHPIAISPELTGALRTLGQRNGATLFMTLLAGFSALLNRYTSQRRFNIGTAIANRSRHDIEGLIGFFANTLVIPADCSGAPTFRELVKRTRHVTMGAYLHQDLPFEKLVEVLQPEREIGRTPLFEVMFILQNAPTSELHLKDLQLSLLPAVNASAKRDLTLHLTEDAGGIAGGFEYNADLFNADTIARLASHFKSILEAVVAEPDRAVCRLGILSDSERTTIIGDWNARRLAAPESQTITEKFERQAARTPHSTAVVSHGQSLTYEQLNRRANQIARTLRTRGVKRGQVVGIYLDRSIDMVVGILGALKAGAGYLSMDPSYPQHRIEHIIADSGVSAVVSRSEYIARLNVGGATGLLLDADTDTITSQPTDNLSSGATGQDVAYVIYTSGSTGRPKGVVVPHASLCQYVESLASAVGIQSADRYVHTASFSFSSSVRQLMMPLSMGATVVLATSEEVKNSRAFLKLVQSSGATVVDIVPSYWRACVQEAQSFDASERAAFRANQLRLVLSASEPLTADVPARWRQAIGSTPQLINMFGQTETTGIATTFPIPNDAAGAGIVPVGRPIPNAQTYILDDNLEPVPVGVSGEIFIGGATLARGYVNQPDQTAERFVPDPFSGESGARLYRTGDLARYRADGSIEFLGRMDHQVKIRGFRVELGEIEAALAEHRSVAACAVIAVDENAQSKRLVAYLVPNEAELTVTGELRSFLKERLPDYMVPSTFVMLDRLPQTTSGKVDRRALPRPDLSNGGQRADYIAPQGEAQERIAAIWSEVLNVSRVGVEDNFFELGGHSLIATQVVSRMRSAFGIEMPLRVLFENPTVASMAMVVEGQQEGSPASDTEAIVPMPRTGELPLSFAQERLWFLEQLESGTSTYNIPAGVRLDGNLDVDALQWSLSEVVRRHEVLRTTFENRDGRAIAVVQEAGPVALPVEDLQHLSDEQQNERVKAESAAEAARPFDLAAGPLVRMKLLRLAGDRFVLLFTLHHIVTDGWSMGVLIREVSALYEARVTGQRITLDELPIQYTDYALWQRERLTSEVLDKQVEWWKEQIGAFTEPLEIPADRPRPAIPSYRGALRSFTLSSAIRERINELGRSSNATGFMTLLAAFQLLLHRYTGRDNFLVGTPVAGRSRAEFEPLIGFFVNNLVIRGDLSGNPDFKQLLDRVRSTTLDAYAHQDVPFERIVDALGDVRDTSRHPVFQVMFVMQNTPRAEVRLPGVTLSQVGDEEHRTSKFDLTFILREAAEGIQGDIEYSTDLFDEATIESMARHYCSVLEQVCADASTRVSDVRLMDEAELSRVQEWNATGVDRPDQRLHELVETQAGVRPCAQALVYDTRDISYAELNARSNQLARVLQTMGIGREQIVAVSAERSPEQIVALLAILKAGAVYLPIDPAYPSDRVEFMLDDAQVSLVLTQQHLLDVLPLGGRRALIADLESEELRGHSDVNPDLQISADDLAYVIYTSGSTGRPKGVMVSHKGLVNLAIAQSERFEVGPGSRVLQFASTSFDASISEVAMTLSTGATLCLASQASMLPGPDLAHLLRTQRITTVTLPPTVLMTMDADGLPDLRTVVSAGEACSGEAVERWAPGRRFFNAYGPTEVTVCATDGECSHPEAKPPIGRPISNTEVFIVDRYLNQVPVGVPGELCVGGMGLARGYLARPDLTAEKFIPNPFTATPGSRLYRTGDLARYRRDGSIDYLGRIDDQVKIRGYRIELGEIESALRAHPQVGEAIAVVASDAHKRVVAYVVPAGAVQELELRTHLESKLPAYMVPAAIVLLEALPVTPNGKVDRRSLASREAFRPVSRRVETQARNSVEVALCSIWAEIIGVPSVDVHDNFFELGGDSILAIQVVARANRGGIHLLPRQIFQHQTVAELAVAAGTMESEPASQGPATGDVPLTPIQHWFFEQNLADAHHYNQGVLFELNRHVSYASMQEAVRGLLAHHDALRLRFAHNGESWKQEYGELADVPVVSVDLSDVPESIQAAKLEEAAGEWQQSLDLASGPVMRVVLFNMGPEKQTRVLVAIHHLVVDGVSWRILLEDFEVAIRQAVNGEPVHLGPKTTSFQVWSRRMQEFAQSPAVVDTLPYWRGQLGSKLIPVDFDGDATVATGKTIALSLDAEETRTLLTQAHQAYNTTPEELLLAAMSGVLARWTGSGPNVVEKEGHGREDLIDGVDVSRTVGWFTAAYPVALDCGSGFGPEDLIKTTKETVRSIPHNGVGWGLLRYSNPATRDELRTTPEPEVSFNYLGQFDSALRPDSCFSPAKESAGADQSPRGKRPRKIALTAMVANGRMNLHWNYSSALHRAETIEGLAADFAATLRSLIQHCTATDAGGFTPSDFPQARLSQNELDDLIAELA